VTALRHDPDHNDVCNAADRHIVVVAPPGTGKTCLSVRLAATIAQDLEPTERVLLVTFSNQARVQLEREAARQLDHDRRRRIEVTNYHGFFWRAVWANRRALGLPLDTQIRSRRTRTEALKAADADGVARLTKHDGVLEAFAEQRFERFRDDRTPDQEGLERMLSTLEHEQQQGRLVFDDLGALFWRLLESFPVLDKAYKTRYPVVIADEHQDASELQDSVVRRLGSRRLIILADPMQLIYGFRGSRPERLERHVEESQQVFELRTPHRWHQDEAAGRWLLAVRTRLVGNPDPTPAPPSLKVIRERYFNAMMTHVKIGAAKAFRDGMASVAVLAAWNSDIGKLRTYLCKQGLYPRQLGSGDDFEEACGDIEQLPLLGDIQSVAHHAIERIAKLVPTLPRTVAEQVKRRLGTSDVDLSGNCGKEARGLLEALRPLYDQGSHRYVTSVVAALDTCAEASHHLPRLEAVRALRTTAELYGQSATDLDSVLAGYAQGIIAASQAAPRFGRGLFVMTVHQAKGKEFDAVILVNAGDAQFPDDDAGRRLFYVAITRASKRWTIIAPEQGGSPLLRHLNQ